MARQITVDQIPHCEVCCTGHNILARFGQFGAVQPSVSIEKRHYGICIPRSHQTPCPVVAVSIALPPPLGSTAVHVSVTSGQWEYGIGKLHNSSTCLGPRSRFAMQARLRFVHGQKAGGTSDLRSRLASWPSQRHDSTNRGGLGHTYLNAGK